MSATTGQDVLGETDIDDLDFASAADERPGGREDEVTATEAESASDSGPLIRVVKGSLSDVELAALVAVLSAAASAPADSGSGLPADLWGTPTSMHNVFAPSSPYGYSIVGRTRG